MLPVPSAHIELAPGLVIDFADLGHALFGLFGGDVGAEPVGVVSDGAG
jgi:hypothetical protein